LICAVFFVAGWGTSQTPSVQIGTFNLEFFTDLNPATGQWCEEHNPRTPKVIEEMAKFIDSLDLEVLALEEVEDAEALDLLLSFMPAGKYAYIVSPKPRRRPANGWPSSTKRKRWPCAMWGRYP